MHERKGGPRGNRRKTKRPTSGSCKLCIHPGPCAWRGSTLGLMLYCQCLEILNNFKQGSLPFHFALDPTHYIVGSEGWQERNFQWDILRGGREIASRKISWRIMESSVDMWGPSHHLTRTEFPQLEKDMGSDWSNLGSCYSSFPPPFNSTYTITFFGLGFCLLLEKKYMM